MNINILIVDDIEANLFSLESLLEELEIDGVNNITYNINIIQSLTGENALKIAMLQYIDLIILDIQMPEMNGFEVAKYLKLNKKTKNIPIIFLTAAFKSDEFIKQGFEVGAIDYFTKPIEEFQFLNKIKLYISLFIKTKQLDELNKDLQIKVEQEVNKSMKQEKLISEQIRIGQMADMIVNISHHWKQPLSIISTIASGILVKIDLGIKNDEENIIIAMNSIVDKTQELSETITDLNNVQNENDVFNYISIEKEIYNAIHLFMQNEIYSNIKIINNINENDTTSLKMNLNDLNYIIFNILSNSYDAYIVNNITAQVIEINIVYSDDSLSILIQDNAGGIKDENLSKVCDLYFTTKHQSSGVGMSLYNVYNLIVNTYKGSFGIENNKTGVTNFIELPLNI